MNTLLEKLKNNTLFIKNRAYVKNQRSFPFYGILLISLFQIPSYVILNYAIPKNLLLGESLASAYILLGFSYGLSTLFLLAYIKIINKAPISSLGFGNKNRFKNFLIGFGIGTLLIIIATLILILTNTVKISLISFGAEPFIYAFCILPAWIIQASSEEIWIRGFYMNRVGAGKPFFAIIISSIFFALGHLQNSNVTFLSIINILLLGLFTAIYVIFTEDLYGVCGFHIAWNFVQRSILGFSVSGKNIGSTIFQTKNIGYNWISGGKFGIEAGISVTLVLSFAIMVILILKSRDKVNV